MQKHLQQQNQQHLDQAFNAYVASVLLYTSELWALTKKQEYTINTFQPDKTPRFKLAKEHQQYM